MTFHAVPHYAAWLFIIQIRAGITLMSDLKSCKILDTVQVVVTASAAESRLSA